MGLGVLRLYSFRLECKLNSINSQIESFQAQQVELKQRLSSLLSPGRIYGYSKKTSGWCTRQMSKCSGSMNPSSLNCHETGNRKDMAASRENEGWFYFFLEKALAGMMYVAALRRKDDAETCWWVSMASCVHFFRRSFLESGVLQLLPDPRVERQSSRQYWSRVPVSTNRGFIYDIKGNALHCRSPLQVFS